MNTDLFIEERLSQRYTIERQLEKEAWRNKLLVAEWLLWQIWPSIFVVFVAFFILTPAALGLAIIIIYLDDGMRQLFGGIFLFSTVICSMAIPFMRRVNPIEKWVSSEMEKRVADERSDGEVG